MDCNLFLSIYIIQFLKIILPNPSHFILSLCQTSISILYSAATLHLSCFRITHPLPKQFPVSIHILIHLPSKFFIYFFFALIYTPFNLSPFFSERFHTSLFVSSSLAANTSFQVASFLLISAFTSHSTTHSLGSFSPLSMSHTLLLHFQPLSVSYSPTYARHYFLHPTLLTSLKRPHLSFSVLKFPQFLPSSPPSRWGSPLNLCSY